MTQDSNNREILERLDRLQKRVNAIPTTTEIVWFVVCAAVTSGLYRFFS